MRTFLFLFLLAFSQFAHSAELTTFGQDIRSLGMGGVRVNDGDQAGAMLWNPAALAYTNGIRWDVLSLGVGINGQEAYDLSQTVSAVDGLDDLSAFYGEPLWAGGQGYTAIAIPYFGIAFYDDFYADFFLNNPTLPELKIKYFNDVGIVLGGGFAAGPLGFGVNVKQINRLGGDKTIGADLLADLANVELADYFQDGGIGYGVDLGMMYRMPIMFSPTLSLAWQNVGDTTFQKTRGSATPPPINDNLTFGATMSGSTLLAGFSAGLEYRHITNYSEQVGKKLHMGAELNLLNFDLRAGFNQGYTTYGVGVDLFIMQLEVATYTVERGAYPGQTPEQRFQVGLSSSFGFDPDFKLMDVGGKRRKLKQRR